MTGQTGQKLTALAAGALWALAVVILPGALGLPYLPAPVALPGALVAPGLALAAMMLARWIGWGGERLSATLTETIGQIVLALALWPFVAMTLGGWMAILLGVSLALTRLLAWVAPGPLLRGLAFAASLLPTLFAALWAVGRWAL